MSDQPSHSGGQGPKIAKSPPGAPKVFDVTRPEKVLASANARPVIVGHQPAVKDSTVTHKPQTMTDHRPAQPLLAHQKTEVSSTTAASAEGLQSSVTSENPPGAPEMPPQTSLATSHLPAAPVNAETQPSAAAELKPTESATMPVEPLHDPAPPAGSESIPPTLESSAVEPPSTAPKPQPSAHDTAEAEVSLADPGAIVVSHHGHHGHAIRWSRFLLALFLLIIVAVVAVDLLLDAGTLKLTTNLPHTHFLKK